MMRAMRDEKEGAPPTTALSGEGSELAPKRSHANADREARVVKAARIEDLLVDGSGQLSSKSLLDIGTGSGHIASYFAGRCASVVGVDVVDERSATDFDFRLVECEQLPFASGSFDVVISNHVIEHVDDQLAHLCEIHRVLRTGGVCYLATPNRFAIVEPHYKLPFLSWLPAAHRDRYVRLAQRGERYDVHPLTFARLRALASAAELDLFDVSPIVASMVAQERLGTPLRALTRATSLLPAFAVTLSARRSRPGRE